MKYPVVSQTAEVQEQYLKLRRRGQSHNMAEMLATRAAPRMNESDRAFMQGRQSNHGLDGDPVTARRQLATARKAGIDVAGKVYIGSIADRRGYADPGAWVSGVDDVKKVCQQRGIGCSGGVSVKSPQFTPPPVCVPLAEDIVQEKMQVRLKENPGLASNLGDLRDAVIERHGSKVDDTFYVDASKPVKKETKQVFV